MDSLLREAFTTHYGLPTYTGSDLLFITSDNYFELEDTANKQMVLSTQQGSGTAKITNTSAIKLTIVNYDKFISDLPVAFQTDKERCDGLMTGGSSFVFIELKDRENIKKARSKARKQLIASLKTIIAVPTIKTFVETKTNKKCCYFNKQAASPSPLNATRAFNRLPNQFPHGQRYNDEAMQVLGFEFWELTGSQTLTIK